MTELKGFRGTPGPYYLRRSDNATPHVIASPTEDVEESYVSGTLVCALPAEIMRRYNSWENARLFAKSYELALFVQKVSEYDKHVGGSFAIDVLADEARALLAEVTGEE